MPIKFACPCGKQLAVAEAHAGKRAKCPACGDVVVIPREAAVARPAPRGNGPAAAPAHAAGATLCAICQSPLKAGEGRTACPGCKAEYHADCWQDNQGCAVYGCAEVPATEHREALEIPVSYWGKEDKKCPKCAEVILAAAKRCRHCGATFASQRPEGRAEFRERRGREKRLPMLRTGVTVLFVCCLIPCLAPFAAVAGLVWYLTSREDLEALPPLYVGLLRLGLGVGVGQTVLVGVMVALFALTHH